MNLLSTNSPLYLRRLVRELNANRINGFWVHSPEGFCGRYSRAELRLKEGHVRLSMGHRTVRFGFDRLGILTFTDAGGQEIVASREP
jgi:hypothetical protein